MGFIIDSTVVLSSGAKLRITLADNHEICFNIVDVDFVMVSEVNDLRHFIAEYYQTLDLSDIKTMLGFYRLIDILLETRKETDKKIKDLLN